MIRTLLRINSVAVRSSRCALSTSAEVSVSESTRANPTTLAVSSVRVHSNAVTQMLVHEFERRFEIYKAAYERPIAVAYDELRREKLQALRDRGLALSATRAKLRRQRLASQAADEVAANTVEAPGGSSEAGVAAISGSDAASDQAAPATKKAKKSRTPMIDARLALIDSYLDEHRKELARMAGKSPPDMLKEFYKRPVEDDDEAATTTTDDNAGGEMRATFEEYGVLESVEDVTDKTEEELRAMDLPDDFDADLKTLLSMDEDVTDDELLRFAELPDATIEAALADDDEIDDLLFERAVEHVADNEAALIDDLDALADSDGDGDTDELDDDDDDTAAAAATAAAGGGGGGGGGGGEDDVPLVAGDGERSVTVVSAGDVDADAVLSAAFSTDDHDAETTPSADEYDQVTVLPDAGAMRARRDTAAAAADAGDNALSDEEQAVAKLIGEQAFQPFYELQDAADVEHAEQHERALTGADRDAMLTQALLQHDLVPAPRTYKPTRPEQAIVFVNTHRPSEHAMASNEFEINDAVYRERRVTMLMHVPSFQLPALVEARLIELVGVRYNANTRTIKMSADRRPNKADNKHVLIQTLRALLSEAFLADSNYIAPLNDESAPGALAAAYEARFLDMLAASGVQIADPLRLGPAFAPASYVSMVARDVAAENALLRVRAPPVKAQRTPPPAAPAASGSAPCMFRFERLPPLADAVAARSACRALAQQLIKSHRTQ